MNKKRSSLIVLSVGILIAGAIFFSNGIKTYDAYAQTGSLSQKLGSAERLSIIKLIETLKAKVAELQRQLSVLIEKEDPGAQATNDLLTSIPLIPQSELVIKSDGISTPEKYFEVFSDKTVQVSFDPKVLESLKNESADKQRPPMLEELIKTTVSGKGTDGTRRALIAWGDLDDRMVEELKKVSVTESVADTHRELISWYAFHASVAKQLSSGMLSSQQINALADRYAALAPIHNKLFGTSVAAIKNAKGFTLIDKAEAFTCGAFRGSLYHFGGKIVVTLYCNYGVVDTISVPCGGQILFTYAGMAVNPYNWHDVYVISNAVLGRSTVSVGTCIAGVPPYALYWPYEAIAVYYGTGPV